DGDRRTWRKAQLRAMGHSPKYVSHVPIRGLRRARHGFATLHILGIGLAAAIDVRTEGSTANRTDARGHVLASAAPDLVAQHPADHAADDGTGDVGLVLPDHLLLLDPATLFRRPHHHTRCHDIGGV